MDYLELVRCHFGYLESELGFELVSHGYSENAFGNFIVVYRRGNLQIRIVRDRLQVFVQLSVDGRTWEDKEVLLAAMGIPMERYARNEIGLWLGYQIENQGRDLKQHWPHIETAMKAKGAA